MNNICNFIKKSCKFGIIIPFTNILLTYGNKLLPFRLLRKISAYRNRKIQRFLMPIIEEVLKENPTDVMGSKSSVPVIWTCWLQGEEQMPEIPKMCLSSMRRFSNGKQVIVITERNFAQYVDLSPTVLNAYKSGQLKPAHFADIIRMNLLSQRGGLWLDATMYVSRELPNELFDRPFYSIKTPEFGAFVSKCRWAVFCLGSWEGNILMSVVTKAFDEYLKRTTLFIDYFLFDQFIDILYNTNEDIKSLIDNIPFNNPNTHNLHLSDNYNYDEWVHLKKDTFMFKLSWKGQNMNDLLIDKTNYYNYLISINK